MLSTLSSSVETTTEKISEQFLFHKNFSKKLRQMKHLNKITKFYSIKKINILFSLFYLQFFFTDLQISKRARFKLFLIYIVFMFKFYVVNLTIFFYIVLLQRHENQELAYFHLPDQPSSRVGWKYATI